MVMNLYIAAEEKLQKASRLTLSNLGAAYELVFGPKLSLHFELSDSC